MGISCKNANFRGSETDFLWGRKNCRGGGGGGGGLGYNNKKWSTGFSSTLNTRIGTGFCDVTIIFISVKMALG